MKTIMLVFAFLLLVVAGMQAQVLVGVGGQMGSPMLRYADESNMRAERAIQLDFGAPISPHFNFIGNVGHQWLGSSKGDYVRAVTLGLRVEVIPIVREGRNAFAFVEIGKNMNTSRITAVRKNHTESLTYGGGWAIAQPLLPDTQWITGLRYTVTDMEKLDQPLKFVPSVFTTVRYTFRK